MATAPPLTYRHDRRGGHHQEEDHRAVLAFAVVRLAREAKRAAAQEARAAAAPGGDGTDAQAADSPATMNAMLRGQLAASKTPEQEP